MEGLILEGDVELSFTARELDRVKLIAWFRRFKDSEN
jgi:hypothetical protein